MPQGPIRSCHPEKICFSGSGLGLVVPGSFFGCVSGGKCRFFSQRDQARLYQEYIPTHLVARGVSRLKRRLETSPWSDAAPNFYSECSHSVVWLIITGFRPVDSGSNPDGSIVLLRVVYLDSIVVCGATGEGSKPSSQPRMCSRARDWPKGAD